MNARLEELPPVPNDEGFAEKVSEATPKNQHARGIARQPWRIQVADGNFRQWGQYTPSEENLSGWEAKSSWWGRIAIWTQKVKAQNGMLRQEVGSLQRSLRVWSCQPQVMANPYTATGHEQVDGDEFQTIKGSSQQPGQIESVALVACQVVAQIRNSV